MENFRYLLVAIAALTLIMSVVSGVNPNYFAGLNAFADHGEDDNRGKSGKDNDKEDEEYEEHESELVQSLGNHSKVSLEIDDEVELEVEIEDGDLEDGHYNVTFACNSPTISEEFDQALDIEDGEGSFETDLSLSSQTYTGCKVEVGNLSATFPSFSIMVHEDEEEEEKEERDHERKEKSKSKLKTEEDGVEIKVELEGLEMEDGSYDAIFACENPAINMTLGNGFEVEDGEGEFEEMIGLPNNTYSGCDITVEGTVIASFDTFTVSEETEEEQEHEVEEKRKEKKERLVTTINGTRIHEKHRSENAASPGEYQPSWNYTLTANGTALHRNQTETADDATATVDINMTVWKSTGAIILLDVIDGTIEVGNQTYTVVLGYALYTIHHDTLRLGALAIDDDGNVYKLRLSGSAVDSEAEFPMESGSIELNFEGSRGPPDRFEDWQLTLEGTVEAG